MSRLKSLISGGPVGPRLFRPQQRRFCRRCDWRGAEAGGQCGGDRHVRRLRPADARHHLLGGQAHPSAAQFYAAGGGITGLQNGLAIAGDYMSAASFLGISGLVYTTGYDGLIYSVGFLVGWPIVMFLIAEPLRNLGKFTFADVASFRFQQTPIRILAACGTLVVVAFYLIAQMVGAGQADQAAVRPRLLDRGGHRRRADDHLCDLRRHGGDDLGADHQGLPAARRRDLHGVHGA